MTVLGAETILCRVRPLARCLAALAALVLTRDARAGTFVFLDEAPEPPRLFGAADADITATAIADEGVLVRLQTASGTWWELSFFPPAGEVFVPGSYVATAAPSGDVGARIGILRQGEECAEGAGSFVVRDATPGGTGRVEAFAADFTFLCTPTGRTLRGAVRFASGDATCSAGSDGTPCDDLNLCTAVDTCRAGACGGTDAPACGTTDACHGVCSPLTGACTAAASDDPSCRPSCTTPPCEPTPCTPTSCDDRDPCTTGLCDATGGCVSAPIPGCWNIAGGGILALKAIGSGLGRTAVCTLRCRALTSGVLLLDSGGTYRAPAAGLEICPAGRPPDAPDEVGNVVHRGGRLILKARNRAALVSALRRCTGDRLTLRRYRTAVRVEVDAGHARMTGTNELRLVTPGRIRTTVRMRVRFAGAPAGRPAPPLDIPGSDLPLCGPDLTPVCVVR